MSLDCLNETIRFGNATLQSSEATKSTIGLFIGNGVLSASLLANGWVLAVSWGTTYIDGIFKYPVCYLALCDALVAVARIARPTFEQFVDGSTYIHYCVVPYALNSGAANAMLAALVPTPLQRCLLFVDVPSLSDHAKRPRSIMMFCAALFILSMAPSFGGILAPPNFCVDTLICPQLPFNRLFFVLERSIFVLSYVGAIVAVSLFVWKVKQMNSMVEQLAAGANVQLPSSEVNMNRDVLAMAVVQTVNPILLTAPIVIIGLGWILGFTNNPSVLLMVIGVFQLNPLVDALSTIYFIKPYRRLALKMVKRLRQILGKPNAINQAPAVVVNVSPPGAAEQNNKWRVTFKGPAPQIQPPIPPVEG